MLGLKPQNQKKAWAVCTLTSVLIIFFWICLLRQGKKKINKWDYTKPKSFYTEKEPINRRKGHLLNERRRFQTMYLIKGYYSKYTKNSYNSTSKKVNSPLKNGQRTGQTFFQRRCADSQQAHRKTLNIINHQGNANQNHKEILTHTRQNGYHQKRAKCWQGRGEKGTLVQCWWECKLVQPLGGQYGVSTKT